MGKSPGKWIKGILFGKKASKSSLAMGRELSRSASEKPARVSSKEPISTSTVDTPLISDLISGSVSDRIDNSIFEKEEAVIMASEEHVSAPSKKDAGKPSDAGLPNDPEDITLEQAVIIVQAFSRGYQARRKFQTLKAVIWLQSAVRGCLVRRQAVATLFCMQGIVRLQAITRGYMVRQARIGNGECRKQSFVLKDTSYQDSCDIKYSPANPLLKNAFICELLASSRTAMPLCLQCGSGDSNSAWSWLLRWSISQVWAPNSIQKEAGNSKIQTVEKMEKIKPKRNERRVPSATLRNDPNHANAGTQKLKLIGKKLSSKSVKSAPEHPGNDKVNHGLKKNQKPIGGISNEDIDVNKPKSHQRKLSKSPAPEFSEQTCNTQIRKSMEDSAEPRANSIAYQLTSHLSSQEHGKLFDSKSQDILPVEKDFKDEQISSDNYNSSQTTSVPAAKHDDQDVTLESVKRVPSYMATTASSQAKAKMQVSPRFGQDAIEKNGLTRRHSLPSTINGKLISSPRVHRLIQSSGKGGIKIDRSLSSSREIADKVNHADWKR